MFDICDGVYCTLVQCIVNCQAAEDLTNLQFIIIYIHIGTDAVRYIMFFNLQIC